MSLVEQLIALDQSLMISIHKVCPNALFDFIMPWFRNPFFWIPVYVFLLYFSVKKFGRNGLLWCLAFIAVFGIADFTAASILKPYFGRLRPCNDPAIKDFLHVIVKCGSGKSFPSAHSSNHFGLSLFIIFTLAKFYKWMKVPAIIWALLVVIAQVYVGVHYPGDILGGLIVGLFSATVVSTLFNKYVPLKPIKL